MLSKGIKGRFKIPYSESILNVIKSNAEAFRDMAETELSYCEYDIYVAEYNEEDIICVDFNIMGHSSAGCRGDLSHFKKEFKRIFHQKLEEIFTISYDKVR